MVRFVSLVLVGLRTLFLLLSLLGLLTVLLVVPAVVTLESGGTVSMGLLTVLWLSLGLRSVLSLSFRFFCCCGFFPFFSVSTVAVTVAVAIVTPFVALSFRTVEASVVVVAQHIAECAFLLDVLFRFVEAINLNSLFV